MLKSGVFESRETVTSQVFYPNERNLLSLWRLHDYLSLAESSRVWHALKTIEFTSVINKLFVSFCLFVTLTRRPSNPNLWKNSLIHQAVDTIVIKFHTCWCWIARGSHAWTTKPFIKKHTHDMFIYWLHRCHESFSYKPRSYAPRVHVSVPIFGE